MSCSFAELYQLRVKVEHDILNGDRTEKQRLALLDQVDTLSKQLGHRQLSTPIKQLSELLHDADPAVCQNAGRFIRHRFDCRLIQPPVTKTVLMWTCTLVITHAIAAAASASAPMLICRIGCEQGVVAVLVQLLQV